MKSCLITGIKGFVGSHLAEFMLGKNWAVYGIDRATAKKDNIEHLLTNKNFHLIDGDITDYVSVKSAVKEANPNYIFHLAAQSFVPLSWSSPIETTTNNIVGQMNIFEACRELSIMPRIQIAGSSEEYGLVKPDETPITEENELRPLSPYAVSKIGQEYSAKQYFASWGIPAIVTRAFNHTGPRREERFVTSNFAKQIVSIEKGLQQPVIAVGNLSAVRDFTDVRDMVRAYYLALEMGEPGEVYNVCSGVGYTIKQVLDILLSNSEAKIEVKIDPERLRPSDVEILLGDHSKFTKATGWTPTIKFEKTMADLLNYWRERL